MRKSRFRNKRTVAKKKSRNRGFDGIEGIVREGKASRAERE